MSLSAEELYRRGIVFANSGRVRGARRTLTRALARTDDVDLRARITGTLAYALSRLGEMDEAAALCRACLDDGGISAATEAVLCGQLGAICVHRGALDEAVYWLTRGIDGGAEAVQRANMLVNRSVVHMQARRLVEARADLSAAAADFAAHGEQLDVATAQHNAGYISLLEGDLIGALSTMAEARVIAAASPVNAAICDLDRAEVLRDAGLSTEAERLLADVARTFGAHRLRQARGEAEFNLARSLLVHTPREAARVAAAAAGRFRALGSDSWAARAEAVRLRALLSSGQFDRDGTRAAVRHAPDRDAVERTAAELESHALVGDAAALRLSWTLARARAGDVSRRMPRVPESAPIPVQLLAHETRAARATAAGRHAQARREAGSGIDRLTRWQSAFGALDLQSSLAMHGTGLMIEGLSSAVRSGRPDLVFEWSERARQMSQQVIALRPPPDPELAAELEQLRLLRFENPTADFLSDPRAAAARDRARERQWTGTAAASVRSRADLEEFQSALADGCALLAYVFSGEALSCLVVTPSRATLVPLGGWPEIDAIRAGLRADLDMSAAVRTGPLAVVVRGALEDRMRRLSERLLEPALRVATGASELIVTVPGVLGGIPWAMMPAMRDHAFTVATSASSWFAGRDEATRAQSAGFAAGPRVPRAEEEVAVAARLWNGARVLQGDAATVDAVTDLASEVDVLHIAAHGRHAVDNPLFSGLDLVDGTLFGYDIDRMPRPPQTVVLSACEVGRSSVRWGEEAVGMTRAWLHAGARCVVAAPVVIADDVACELLGAMHEGLVAGESPARALAAASRRTGLVAPLQCHGSGF